MKKRTNEYFTRVRNKRYLKRLGVEKDVMTEYRFIDILKNHRQYKNEIMTYPEMEEMNDEVYTVQEWNEELTLGTMCNDFGSGYWAKDGKYSDDEVFGTPQLDATHVVWFNK